MRGDLAGSTLKSTGVAREGYPNESGFWQSLTTRSQFLFWALVIFPALPFLLPPVLLLAPAAAATASTLASANASPKPTLPPQTFGRT